MGMWSPSPSTRRQAVKDLEIAFEHRVGALADMGEALGLAGVSVEGGGAFAVPGGGLGHSSSRMEPRPGPRSRMRACASWPSTMSLRCGSARTSPASLAKIARQMADAGVSIDVLYSDHGGQLILVVDDPVRGKEVAEAWARESAST
jgi:hypothetical protein